MSVIKVLEKAVHCDRVGRILEAQQLYEEGTDMLLAVMMDEDDETRRKSFNEHLNDYIRRAKHIKERVNLQLRHSKLLKTIHLAEGSEGNSYMSLFGRYINQKVKEVVLEEPDLNESFQFQNLVVFLELLKKKCRYMKYIRIITKPDSKELQSQYTKMNQIKADLENRDVTLIINYDETMQERKILLSNGYVIKTDRGLHFFQPANAQFCLGLVDFDFRKCLETDVHIWFIRNFG